MNEYIIPANTKKGQLILNTFRPIDMGILGIGALITLILLFALPGEGLIISVIKLLPIAICLLLVMPVPYYHNVLVFIQELINYFSNPTRYLWRGWCATYESRNEQK